MALECPNQRGLAELDRRFGDAPERVRFGWLRMMFCRCKTNDRRLRLGRRAPPEVGKSKSDTGQESSKITIRVSAVQSLLRYQRYQRLRLKDCLPGKSLATN